MSYRKITVDGKQYEYVVGRTHTKVKGVGTWPNTELHQSFERPEYCECCGEPLHELYDEPIRTGLAVMPNRVAAQIKAHI